MTQAAQSPGHLVEPRQIWGNHQAVKMLAALRLPRGRPLILLNGSTNGALTDLYQQASPFLQDGLARWLVKREAVTITGGTDAGIFALLGQGFGAYGQPAACVGVTVAGMCSCHHKRKFRVCFSSPSGAASKAMSQVSI